LWKRISEGWKRRNFRLEAVYTSEIKRRNFGLEVVCTPQMHRLFTLSRLMISSWYEWSTRSREHQSWYHITSVHRLLCLSQRYGAHRPENGTRNSMDWPQTNIDRIIEVGERKYVVPTNPYEASYFLPATHFKRFLAQHLARHGYGFAQDISSIKTGLIREHHAGLFKCSLLQKPCPSTASRNSWCIT